MDYIKLHQKKDDLNVGIFLNNPLKDFIKTCFKNEILNKKEINKINNDLNINNSKIANKKTLKQQKEIYNKLLLNNSSSFPNYINGLNINNALLSKNNKSFLQKISEITEFSLINPLEVMYKEKYEALIKASNTKEKCPICSFYFYNDIIPNNNQNLKLKELNIYISH